MQAIFLNLSDYARPERSRRATLIRPTGLHRHAPTGLPRFDMPEGEW